MEPVKNPLRNLQNYRRPAIWIVVVILILLITASIGLLSNRENKLSEAPPNEPEGSAEILYHMTDSTQGPTDFIGGSEIDIFEFEKLLYLSPLSSSTFDFAESRIAGTKCIVTNELFKIDYTNEDDYEIQNPKYKEEKMTDDMTQAFEKSAMSKVSISEYKEKYRYTIYTEGNRKTNYYLYVLDGQLWLSSYADNTADKSEIAMYIWKLK